MSDDGVYRELQQALDRMPVGFPPMVSGVEIRILRQLFTPLEAQIALCVGLMPEPVPIIYKRLNVELSRESLAEALDRMAYRGLIRRQDSREGPRYGKLPFVVGIYEGQVDRMSKDLARDLLEYFDGALGDTIRPKATPQIRTVPVNRSIAIERAVARYDDIRASVESTPGPFAVMNCICRQARDLAGEPCRQTAVLDNCLTMGAAAKVMLDHGRARETTRERILELLDEADREGLVLQPQNTRNPLFICCCCGCCCVALRAAKRQARPADFCGGSYFAEVDESQCDACGACVGRCQMNAISMGESAVRVDTTRCVGCGLCLTACPPASITLKRKARVAGPPRDTEALYARIYRERYGNAAFAKAALRLLRHRLD